MPTERIFWIFKYGGFVMSTKVISNNQLLLKECIKQEYQESNTYATENDFFEFFASSQVLKNYNLSDDEIESGLTGGGLDGGCDGIFVFLNGDLLTSDQINTITASKGSLLNLTIVQSKNTTSFKEDAIMKWKTVSENLLSLSNSLDDYTDRYNEATRDGFCLFRDALTKLIRSQIKTAINYYYITLADELHPNVEHQAEELKDIIKRIYPSTSVTVEFIGADKLMDLYNTDSETNIAITLADTPIALGRNDEYVSLINIANYYKFITFETGTLRKSFFESNVRDYQGKNSVNTCIQETLSNKTDEDFWWLNNGVTILTSKITPVTNKELVLMNPEIVNGLQTSTEIYNYFSENPSLLDTEDRNVLVRIITPKSEESRDNIIFATNNQTNIPKSSLRVTDTIHLQIEMYFKSRGLYYDRRKNYYKNQKKKSTEIVGVSFLAQCLISLVLRKPDFARARPSTLLTDDQTYKKLYEDSHDLDSYYKAAKIGKIIQQNVKSTSDMSQAEKSDILFYLIYAVVAKVLNKCNITFQDLKDFDLDSLNDNVINNCKTLIYSKYKELGGNGRVAKSSEFILEIDELLGL